MFTFGKTGCGTGGLYSFINDFGMLKSFDSCLLYQNLITYRAMCPLCKPGFTTSGFNCRVNHLAVSKSFERFLLFNHFTAQGTMLTFCKSCFCASGFHGFVYNNHVNMSRIICRRGNLLIWRGDIFTGIGRFLCVTARRGDFLIGVGSSLYLIAWRGQFFKRCGSTIWFFI